MISVHVLGDNDTGMSVNDALCLEQLIAGKPATKFPVIISPNFREEK